MTSDAWDPDQYARFREERQQPFYDLLKLVLPKKGMRIVDLGCGTGELTREMHRHFKAQTTLGVDSSESMLAQSAEHDEAGLSFEHGLIESFPPRGELRGEEGAWDLVLSNAALHWVPDHEALLARLTAALAPGGQLAIQMPANQDHPTHTIVDELAREEPFAGPLGGVGARQHVLPVEAYAPVLARLGYRAQCVRLQVYLHKLPSREGALEWVKGAMLTDVKSRLSDDLYARFLERYRERLLPRLEDTKPYLYTFKRLFLWAERA
jgi:trans-aconitate 2-methyltransferase